MKFKELGRSGLQIPVIGQGCMGIGGGLTQDNAHDESHIRALQLGIDLGLTFIDIAEAYGQGHAEELVGRAIEGRRDDIIISTKFSPENNGYQEVLLAAERSLKRLRTDRIDLYQVHWPNPTIPLEETMRAMEELLRNGKVRQIGLSNFSKREMMAAQACLKEGMLQSNQVEYNLFDRFIEKSGIYEHCLQHGMTIIAYSPLDKGCLAPNWKRLVAIAAYYEKTVSQIILNWLQQRPGVILIPKALQENHIRENATASDFAMSAEHIAEIDRLFPAEWAQIPPDIIEVSQVGEDNRKVYRTLQEAIENCLNFVPSPRELSQDILRGEPVKPVRLMPRSDGRYDLIEGRVRYWAYVIAYGNKPIPAYIR